MDIWCTIIICMYMRNKIMLKAFVYAVALSLSFEARAADPNIFSEISIKLNKGSDTLFRQENKNEYIFLRDGALSEIFCPKGTKLQIDPLKKTAQLFTSEDMSKGCKKDKMEFVGVADIDDSGEIFHLKVSKSEKNKLDGKPISISINTALEPKNIDMLRQTVNRAGLKDVRYLPVEYTEAHSKILVVFPEKINSVGLLPAGSQLILENNPSDDPNPYLSEIVVAQGQSVSIENFKFAHLWFESGRLKSGELFSNVVYKANHLSAGDVLFFDTESKKDFLVKGINTHFNLIEEKNRKPGVLRYYDVDRNGKVSVPDESGLVD